MMEALATYLLATRPDAVALCQGTDQAVLHFLKANQLPQRPTSTDIVSQIYFRPAFVVNLPFLETTFNGFLVPLSWNPHCVNLSTPHSLSIT